MDRFTLAAPPTGPGVYMLRKIPTDEVYIGQAKNLRQRWAEWKVAAQSGIGFKSPRMKDAMTDPVDWEFIILQEYPGADRDALLKAEAAYIRGAQRQAGEKLLNTITPTDRRSKQSCLFTYTMQGTPVSTATAAAALQCGPHTLRKRAAKLRARGVFSLSVEFLLERSHQYRRSGQPWAEGAKVAPVESLIGPT